MEGVEKEGKRNESSLKGIQVTKVREMTVWPRKGGMWGKESLGGRNNAGVGE